MKKQQLLVVYLTALLTSEAFAHGEHSINDLGLPAITLFIIVSLCIFVKKW